MGFHTTERALIQQFATAFPAVEPTVLVVQENQEPPGDGRRPESDEWVRISVVHSFARTTEIGGPHSMNLGRVTVEIFTQLHEGTGRSRQIADKVVTIFQNQRIGNASCMETEHLDAGPAPNLPQFWREIVSTKFRFENTPA